MKLKELVEALAHYPQDAQVLITWEGTDNELDHDLIYLRDGKVFLDGDSGRYKREGVSLTEAKP